MYSNSNRSIYKIATLIISASIGLFSCATAQEKNGETKANNGALKSLVEMDGDQKCIPEGKRIPMSRELIRTYAAYYPNN